MTPRPAAPLVAFLAMLGGPACDRAARLVEREAPAPVAAPAPAARPPRSHNLLDELARCDLEHRGILLDLGTPAVTSRHGFALAPPAGIADVEQAGVTWARVTTPVVRLSFLLPEPRRVSVSLRVRGGVSKQIAVLVDDERLGGVSTVRDQVRVLSTRATDLPLDAGAHTVTLRLSGKSRHGRDPLADLDWVHLAFPDDDASTFAAPTLTDVVEPAASLAGVPHRAAALRAPGAMRCAVLVAPGTRLRAAVGHRGAGEGEVVVRVLEDGREPVRLGGAAVAGGPDAAWTELELPLDTHAGRPITLELRAERASQGGRMLLGDPRLERAGAEPPAPAARVAVLVVLAGVDRSMLPPWTPAPRLPALSELAMASAVFDRHRAPTTLPAGSFATLLTGLPPIAHTVEDGGARLPAPATTLATLAREASVPAAFFTGVPTTFRSFGFDRGWHRFREISPALGVPATAPLEEAARWLAEVASNPRARALAVVHARGGHPPWDVPPARLADLPPAEYAGPIEPRRSAQVLARAARAGGQPLGAADRERARALLALALHEQDRALGELMLALRAVGAWDSTLFVLTGDVATASPDPVSFPEGAPLEEPRLALPLYVKFPGGAAAGARVARATGHADVSRTALVALGLGAPKDWGGRDLYPLARGEGEGVEEPQVATLPGAYSVRWGDVVLAGRLGEPPRACDLRVDELCAFDRRAVLPLATQALFRRQVEHEAAHRAPLERREPASLDAEAAAALRVWGLE